MQTSASPVSVAAEAPGAPLSAPVGLHLLGAALASAALWAALFATVDYVAKGPSETAQDGTVSGAEPQ